MTLVETARLRLHPVDVAEAARIHAARPAASDRWAPGYPFAGDLDALDAFLAASATGERRPFGYYQISRSADELAIGGIGFFGPPRDGVVEVGYGLIPGARGHGYAREALLAVLDLAASLGVRLVVASTEIANVASQRTLLGAGFDQVRVDSESCYYERTF